MNKKYEITDITMKFKGRTLYRIRALKDFRDVEAGDLGGWIQSENNLSQEGDCWIYDNAKCMDNARMYDNSIMHNNSVMCDFSEMHDNSAMYNNAVMYNNSEMYDYATMYDYSEMHDCSEMLDSSVLYRDSMLKDEEKLYGELFFKVDKFIEIYTEEAGMVTGVLRNGKILFSIDYYKEIDKEEFIDRINNPTTPYEEECLKVINKIESYLK